MPRTVRQKAYHSNPLEHAVQFKKQSEKLTGMWTNEGSVTKLDDGEEEERRYSGISTTKRMKYSPH